MAQVDAVVIEAVSGRHCLHEDMKVGGQSRRSDLPGKADRLICQLVPDALFAFQVEQSSEPGRRDGLAAGAIYGVLLKCGGEAFD